MQSESKALDPQTDVSGGRYLAKCVPWQVKALGNPSNYVFFRFWKSRAPPGEHEARPDQPPKADEQESHQSSHELHVYYMGYLRYFEGIGL